MTLKQPTPSDVAAIGLTFAQAIARGDWPAAHAMLASSLRADCPPAALRSQFEAMTSYWEKPPTSVQIAFVDAGRAYVAITSLSASYGTVQEAVDVRVIYEADAWRIDDIVWGRP